METKTVAKIGVAALAAAYCCANMPPISNYIIQKTIDEAPRVPVYVHSIDTLISDIFRIYENERKIVNVPGMSKVFLDIVMNENDNSPLIYGSVDSLKILVPDIDRNGKASL